KLLPIMFKEVMENYREALAIKIDFKGQSFYLDAQGRTVWPNQKIPRYFTTTLNKARGYVESIFLSPSVEQPLILQIMPGYYDLPAEIFSLIQCFEQAKHEPISRLAINDQSGEILKFWHNLSALGKCFFIAPLGHWQYERLQGTKILHNYRKYRIGQEQEPMEIADAQVSLFNPQLSENIKVRAAMIKRKEESLALITNILPQDERYIRKIAELYFQRWLASPAGGPAPKVKSYYDLLEEAHQQVLSRSQGSLPITRLKSDSYDKKPPEEIFRLFLEQLNRYCLNHFFPSEYEARTLQAMRSDFYQQGGYLKMKQDGWQVWLRRFTEDKLNQVAQIACQRFNQSDVRLPENKRLRLYLSAA
ncbi:MAG: hypothetical protein JW714_01035, partial [Candidatus Omnitrophica bacterium]|nr:hypothetical protein [Candidatus Omnitrophota bacterium]